MEDTPRSGDRLDAFALVVAFALAIGAFGGCAVGTAYISAPERLPSKALPPLTRPIGFDVCVSPDRVRPQPQMDEALRKGTGDRVRKALSPAGVSAELTPTAGSPVDFTVALRKDDGAMWSFALSLVTLSIVPGYAVQRTTLDVDLAWRDAAQIEKSQHLRYQARTRLFLWLPLVVYPDLILAMDDGWASPKIEDGGFKQIVGRLGDDLRARLGRDGAGRRPSAWFVRRPSPRLAERPGASSSFSRVSRRGRRWPARRGRR